MDKKEIIPGPKVHTAKRVYTKAMLDKAEEEQKRAQQERQEDQTID